VVVQNRGSNGCGWHSLGSSQPFPTTAGRALRLRDQTAPPPHQKIPKIFSRKPQEIPHLSHRAAQISSPKRNTAPVLQRNPALFDNSITAARRTNFVGLASASGTNPPGVVSTKVLFSVRNPGTTPEPKGTQKYHFGTTKYHLGTSWEPLRNHKVPLFLPLKIIISAPAALYRIETPHFPTLRQTPRQHLARPIPAMHMSPLLASRQTTHGWRTDRVS